MFNRVKNRIFKKNVIKALCAKRTKKELETAQPGAINLVQMLQELEKLKNGIDEGKKE